MTADAVFAVALLIWLALQAPIGEYLNRHHNKTTTPEEGPNA